MSMSRAHGRVASAVARGLLPRASTLTCVDCGRQAQVYDHRDYDKPLAVDGVCRSCNTKRGPAIQLRNRPCTLKLRERPLRLGSALGHP